MRNIGVVFLIAAKFFELRNPEKRLIPITLNHKMVYPRHLQNAQNVAGSFVYKELTD